MPAGIVSLIEAEVTDDIQLDSCDSSTCDGTHCQVEDGESEKG